MTVIVSWWGILFLAVGTGIVFWVIFKISSMDKFLQEPEKEESE